MVFIKGIGTGDKGLAVAILSPYNSSAGRHHAGLKIWSPRVEKVTSIRIFLVPFFFFVKLVLKSTALSPPFRCPESAVVFCYLNQRSIDNSRVAKKTSRTSLKSQ